MNRSPLRRSSGSLAPCAWAAVAASCVGSVGFFGLGVGGCLVTQDLGAADAGARQDSQLVDESGSSPDAGFDPQLQKVDLDVSKCPRDAIPVAGTPCPTNFIVEDKAPVQCNYRELHIVGGADGIARRMCGRSCVCAFDGNWSCIDAPCGWPSRSACGEGMPCLAGVGCLFACEDGADPSTCRSCTCGADERFSCGPVPTK